MVSIKLEGISKKFNNVNVLENIHWQIHEREFMILAGPSGCGKTTLLKLILGVLTPDRGNIYMNEELITNVPVSKRGIGFVPQEFGLFPHLTVFNNIGYGLKIRNIPMNQIHSRVSDLIKMLKLENLEERKPRELSWGQKQRVALARAIAIEPNLLLLDEPLSSVDWITKMEIAKEIQKLQEQLKITVIFITHDIDEAYELGQRITIMSPGKIEQCDTPKNLINNPKTDFVKSFIYQNKHLKRIQALKELE